MKKTITIEFTFKKWMKLALLAALFLILSYLFMTGANAQVPMQTGTVASISCCTNLVGYTPKAPDPTFKQVWFALVSIAFLLGAVGIAIGTIINWNDEKEE